MFGIGIGFAVLLFIFTSAIKVLTEWERAVVLRFGRSIGVKGPGLIMVLPFIDSVYRVDTRVVTMDVPPQDIITEDNVSMKVNAVVYFRTTDPEMAVTKVADYYFATSQYAQTLLRSVLGQFPMDEILSKRENINQRLQELIDKHTEAWGIKVTSVELKNIDLPKEMQAAMARQAEAERERRAKVISAEGELQRSQKLAEASNILAQSPSALQLAYLQALNEITGPTTKTIIFPLPIDMITPFIELAKRLKN
jgi:regulator of protease activity HflC (stomatin/prohibitin superfamily)